jgi:hypothetical protein
MSASQPKRLRFHIMIDRETRQIARRLRDVTQLRLFRNGGRSLTLLGAFGLVPDVVGDGRGRHGGARFSSGGCSYD